MRKIETQMNTAIRNKKNWAGSNTSVRTAPSNFVSYSIVHLSFNFSHSGERSLFVCYTNIIIPYDQKTTI